MHCAHHGDALAQLTDAGEKIALALGYWAAQELLTIVQHATGSMSVVSLRKHNLSCTAVVQRSRRCAKVYGIYPTSIQEGHLARRRVYLCSCWVNFISEMKVPNHAIPLGVVISVCTHRSELQSI